MDLPMTVALGAAALLLAALFGWLGARPPNPLKGPRLIPWRFLMLLAAVGVMLMVVHAINLMGVVTGPPA